MDSEKLLILSEILGEHYRSNDEHLFFCPFCKHHKRKLSVNISKNTYKCWVCDSRGRNLYFLVRRFGNHSHKQHWKSFESHVEISEFENIFEEKVEEQEVQRIKLPEEYICLANKRLPRTAMPALRYLRERGLTDKDILKWKIGFCDEGNYRNRVIVPSFNDEGYCDYFIARSYTDDWMKYKNPPVSKNIVFNRLSIFWNEPIILVEGVFDAFKAENSIPLLGSTLYEGSLLFQAILKHNPAVYLALDADAQKKTLKIARSLIQYGIETWNIDTSGCEDVGEMTKEEFLARKENATIMDSDSYLLYEALSI